MLTRRRSPTAGPTFEAARHADATLAPFADPAQRVVPLRSTDPDHAWTEDGPTTAIADSITTAGPMIFLDILRICIDRKTASFPPIGLPLSAHIHRSKSEFNDGRLFEYPGAECRNNPAFSAVHRPKKRNMQQNFVRIWTL